MPWTDVGFKKLCLDWLLDPQRRKQVCSRTVEQWVPTFLVLLWFMPWMQAATLTTGIVFLTFVFYEFLLEPFWSWVGNYWERGPRDGTTFVKW